MNKQGTKVLNRLEPEYHADIIEDDEMVWDFQLKAKTNFILSYFIQNELGKKNSLVNSFKKIIIEDKN